MLLAIVCIVSGRVGCVGGRTHHCLPIDVINQLVLRVLVV
jgi:hypothetical protein